MRDPDAGKDPRRKSIEALSLAGLAFIFWITWQALHGPNPLPERVPTHFDAAGHANAWGPPETLWLLPVLAGVLYLLITVLSLLPTTLKSKRQLTPEKRAQLEALTRRMVAWLKLELICLFAWIQWSILQSLEQGSSSISPWTVPVFIAAVTLNVAWHIAAIFRVVSAGAGS
jgi:uncharacterized membrane protein